jgi:23S rRNA pseudouridine2457 synthase
VPSRLIALHKPYDVLCQFTDAEGRATLKAFVSIPEIYPVGRLDRDSEGLLLLTDDGRLVHRLTDPKYEHPRTYLVQVERIPDDEALERLRRGVMLRDGPTRRADVERLIEPPELPERSVPIRFRKSVPTAWLRLTLREGRNRQVRCMTASVDHPTLRLVRVAIGPVTLGGLAPGQWREVSEPERQALEAIRDESPRPPRRPQSRRRPQDRKRRRS